MIFREGRFYNESLKAGPAGFGIEKARIIMVDCDTYTAAKDVFSFCVPIIQEGTIFVLDDYLAYKSNRDAGITKAFADFLGQTNTEAREFTQYGIGASVYVINKINP